jgi:hypothetical protein
MTNGLKRDWLQIVWNRSPGLLLRKHGMLVLDAYKGPLTPEIRSAVHAMSTD